MGLLVSSSQFITPSIIESFPRQLWIDLPSLPRKYYPTETRVRGNDVWLQSPKMYPLNKQYLLIIAYDNIILFDTINSTYNAISKIPRPHCKPGIPTYLHMTMIMSDVYNNIYEYLLVIAEYLDKYTGRDRHCGFFKFRIYFDLNNIPKCEWINIKTKHYQFIPMQFVWQVLADKYDKNNTVFVYHTDEGTNNENMGDAKFHISCYDMDTLKIHCTKKVDHLFGVNGIISIDDQGLIIFRRKEIEILRYNRKVHQLLTESTHPYPSHKYCDCNTTYLKYSNYIIELPSSGDIWIYDYINHDWYKTNVKMFINPPHRFRRRSEGVVIDYDGFLHCMGYNTRNYFYDTWLHHYKLNVKQMLDGIGMFYWDNRPHSKVCNIVNSWIRKELPENNNWALELSLVVMKFICIAI